jgi:uncharacterized protein (DUF1684 family)
MRISSLIVFPFLLLACNGEENNLSYKEQLVKERKETNKYFASPGKSPLPKEDAASFVSLNYFPIDTLYRVPCKIIPIDTAKPFAMPTTTARTPFYRKVALAIFSINGVTDSLSVFKNEEDPDDDVLFIPFLDETNGFDTYGGGRYLDLKSLDPPVLLDFNRAYNPYCAYNPNFSCPIPPLENTLSMRIEAGEKTYGLH